MTVTAGVVAALLLFEAPPAAAGDCALTDNRCKARQYEQRGSATSLPGPRALYLYNAYRSYLILFEKDGRVDDLCEARRTLDASLAVDGQPQAQRLVSQRKHEVLASLLRQHGAHCKTVNRRQRGEKKIGSDKSRNQKVEAKAETHDRATFRTVAVAEPVGSGDDRSKLPSEVTALETQATKAAAPALNTASSTPASPLQDDPTRPSRALERPYSPPQLRLDGPRSRVHVGVGVGLVTLGAGLLAGMTAALVGRHSYDEKIATLNARAAQEHRPLTAPEMADSTAWDARFVRLEKTGAVLGGVAAVSVVAAIIVLAMPRRSPRSQARVHPMGAGVHIKF